MSINNIALAEMEVLESYLEALPKNGRACLGDVIYRYNVHGKIHHYPTLVWRLAEVDWLKEKIDNSSLFARDGDYDLAIVGRWISIEVFALISPFFCRALMLLFCMKTYS
ncbi:uncharacterized protein LOC131333056 [Rhododendron vialii]|uniref:uncharacterized protein LOC131333056 n=1 Tax=Rhododendron vialii TaxID=182163 RepID=UPI00265EBC57|nr:uncharacterized protein LOC131333056 [Rhododendron vialii]